jgi:mannosyltransferase OCH1-like enzyme
MIPKIVHMCWLSGDPFPPEIRECLVSWREHLVDYEIWLWGKIPGNACSEEFKGMKIKEISFDLNSSLWTKQSFNLKKYAFTADYIRLFALYYHGGIYLDSDVMVYKNFDDLLSLPYFLGLDHMNSYEPAAMGAEKGIGWVKTVLHHYDNRNFIINDNEYDTIPLPKVFYLCLSGKSKVKILHTRIKYDYDENFLFLFDRKFFNSRNVLGPKRYNKSYCSHCYVGSWLNKTEKSLKIRLLLLLPMPLRYIAGLFNKYVMHRKSIGKFGPQI